MRRAFTFIFLSSFGLLALACPADEAAQTRVGVDASLKDLGFAEYLQAAYEEGTKARMTIRYLDTDALHEAALAGEVDYAVVLSEATRDALLDEGVPIRAEVFAHEELIFIGPFKDYLGKHSDRRGEYVLQAIARANYRYLKPKKGSVERARHDLLFERSGDRMEPGAFMESDESGEALVKATIEGNAFSLVKRSSLLLAAQDGMQPHRVYREGDEDLVLRLALVEVHPAKTRRERRPGFFDFVTGDEGQKIIETFGAQRFGIPVYGAGEPPEGEGAAVPALTGKVEATPPPSE